MLEILQVKNDSARSVIAEANHDRKLRQFASINQPAYDRLVEDMVKCRDTQCLSPDDGSDLKIGPNGRSVFMSRPVTRSEGMPKHDAADILCVAMDRCWQREEAKPNSERSRLYQDIASKVFTSCAKHGLPIPDVDPIVGTAIERGGIDSSSIPLVEVEAHSDQFQPGSLRARTADIITLPPRHYGLKMLERGGLSAVHQALMEHSTHGMDR